MLGTSSGSLAAKGDYCIFLRESDESASLTVRMSQESKGKMPFAGEDSLVVQHLKMQSQRCLDAYQVNSLLVKEHANIERATAQGGYGRRQIYELVQNGADALVNQAGGKIHVLLTESSLYCANEGEPIDTEGVDAILSSHISMKRGSEIGRFGLGFKSVLGVTQQPQFFSRSGSFGFNKVKAAETIRSIIPNAQTIPVLRIAFSVDIAEARAEDAALSKLMGWATTIVKLPRDSHQTAWLSQDIQAFPPEFLLFSPHVGLLTLEDKTSAIIREIRIKNTASQLRLIEGTNSTAWKLFSTSCTPSPDAQKDAGELADREKLPVIWAVPHGRPTPGRFWAFFPTEYITTLSGILNAPWKTNEDRQNLLTGAFNDELLRTAAGLVVENLPHLLLEKDPGWYLDILPARKDEHRNWADARLNDYIYELAGTKPSLPNQLGKLVCPGEVELHPNGIPTDALAIWASYPNRPINWCHFSVETRTRRVRAERLIATTSRTASTVEHWLEALVEDKTPAASIAALQAAASIRKTDLPIGFGAGSAKIVLTTRGDFVAPQRGQVFLPAEYATLSSDFVFVHEEVASNREAREALVAFGLTVVDARSELEAHLSNRSRSWGSEAWDKLWMLVELAGNELALGILSAHGRADLLKVRTISGEYRPLRSTLLPGRIASQDDMDNAKVVVDVEFHEGTLELLKALGAVDGPYPGKGTTSEIWFSMYRAQVIEEYFANLSGTSRPQQNYLHFDKALFGGPLEPMPYLRGDALTRFSLSVLEIDDGVWTLSHQTRSSYPVRTYAPPSLWMTKKFGFLPTSLGPRRVTECVSPALSQWTELLSVARCTSEIAHRLSLPDTLSDLTQGHWSVAFQIMNKSEDDASIGHFYATVVSLGVSPPDNLICRVGNQHKTISRHLIHVIAERREFDALVSQSVPMVLAPTPHAAGQLVEIWNLKPAVELVRTELKVAALSSPVPLTDKFPALRWYADDTLHDYQLVQCSSVRLETLTANGRLSEETQLHVEHGSIYFVESLSDENLLKMLGIELKLDLSASDETAVLEQRAAHERRRRVLAVRDKSTLCDRLLTAVNAAMIRRRLPIGLLRTLETNQELTDQHLAELALVVYGVDTLRTFRLELEEAGLNPPAKWGGSRAARAFVSELGFPVTFSGFDQEAREPVLVVDGPPQLPPLHSFQVEITGRIRRLLRGDPGLRGLLSLPTGAGKTRVTVQALTDAIRDGELNGPLLWVAQTDELCEQAVQCWSEVWRALGPQESLCISRLWAANEAEASAAMHVVVATISKLQGCIDDAEYGWLAGAQCIVIDEAHGSITPAYTALLDWLGLGRGKNRCPLLGMTATPFRGSSEEETIRLVRRYGECRLDLDVLGDDPYRTLQELGILATVRHLLIDGAEVQLTDIELQQLIQMRRLPSSAEDRIALDSSRNAKLIASIMSLPVDWPVLLFAASVDHAQTIAALLSMEGVSAAPVSGNTEPGVRRYYVDQFKGGRLRVLTNYGVFAEGFDAPAVKAIYVARPTFSPNLYQQMIGRGLRGPLNGGKDECLIVNVADNFLRYGADLAFRGFEYLWRGESS